MKPYKVLDELDSMAPIDCLHRMLQLSSFKIYIDCRNNVCLRCVWITMAPYINSGVNRAFWERMRKLEGAEATDYLLLLLLVFHSVPESEVRQVLPPLSSCRLIEHGRHSLAIS